MGEFKATADMEKRRAERAITNYLAVVGKELPKNHEKRLTKIEKKATATVPKRLFRGPIPISQWARKLSMKEKDALWKLNQEHKESRVLGTLALYWTNGDRDLLEISKLVELETNQRDLEYLIEYFKLLEKMGVIELKTDENL